MIRLLGYLTVAAAVLLGGVWVAAQVDLTLFSPGTPILADEVNANFAALDDGKQGLITGSCAEGSSIRAVAPDGSVTCEVDSVGGPGSGGVTAINGLSDAIVLQGGDNIVVGNDKSGQITIQAADGPEGNGHDHLGQSWSGSDDPLVIGGSFSDSPFTPFTAVGAPLVLSNDATSGHALRVTESWGGLLFEDVHRGIHIADSNTYGLRVQSAQDGILIEDVARDGVVIDNAAAEGIHIGQAGGRGIEILSAGEEALYIGQAGSNGIFVGGSPFSGVVVNNANRGFLADNVGYGLLVGDASVGVFISDAGTGADITAEFNGVTIDSGRNGVEVDTDNASYYGGRFRNTATGGAGLYVSGGGNNAPDIVLGTSGPGDDGRIYSDPALPSSDIFLVSQDGIRFDLDNNGGEDGSFEIYDEANNRILNLDEAGNLALDGSLSENSDRAAKRDIEAIDPLAILKALREVPIQSWSYHDTPGVRHLGPMAQDFHAAFGLGAEATSIATIDRDGVALAAIQALYDLTLAKDARIAELEAQQGALLMRLEALERGAVAGR